ncbi:MAG: helix-turn-helix domain-containing protein [Candidatus Rokuibacteriota bacterium]
MTRRSLFRFHLVGLQRALIVEALRDSRGNVTHAARALGIQRTYLHRLLRQHGFQSRNFR